MTLEQYEALSVEKLLKLIMSVVTSVRPSAWNKSVPTIRIFVKF